MSCEVCSLDAVADSVMWACVGCSRKFHAACIGVHVQCKSLRNKDKKKIDVTSCMFPCCGPCQNLITANFEFNMLVEQQAKLADQIIKNTEVTHRSTVHQNNISIVHEAIDRLEVLLIDIKKQLTTTGSGLTGNVSTGIKTHITSLFDIAMQNSKGISHDLKCLHDEIKQISKRTLDMATESKMQTPPEHPTSNIADELNGLKNKSDEVIGIKNHLTSLFNISMEATRTRIEDFVRVLTEDLSRELKSICDEVKNLSSLTIDMAAQCTERCLPPIAPQPDSADSGWRVLGNRKVWKADWTDYDARKIRRLNQQKMAEKARKRKKQKRTQYNNNSSHNRSRYNNNNNQQRNIDDDFIFNEVNNNNHYYNSKPSPNLGQNVYNNNNNINQSNHSMGNRQNGNHQLPPDRELLAAAKDRFSRPPANYEPTIQFRRGEILNPYPANVNFQPTDSTHLLNRTTPPSSCDACSCRHSCFPRN